MEAKRTERGRKGRGCHDGEQGTEGGRRRLPMAVKREGREGKQNCPDSAASTTCITHLALPTEPFIHSPFHLYKVLSCPSHHLS